MPCRLIPAQIAGVRPEDVHFQCIPGAAAAAGQPRPADQAWGYLKKQTVQPYVNMLQNTEEIVWLPDKI